MTQRLSGSRPNLACFAVFAILATPVGLVAQSGGGSGKVPITTSSSEARQQYLQGRTLGENLRAYDARQILSQAAAKDPNFALAHYSLAQNAGSAKDFFEHLKQAVALSGKGSKGERLMILGLQAGANADTKLQRDYYEQLVAAYPRDERAHFLLGNAYFGQQNYEQAVGEYHKAVELAPTYAPAYNLLGYAERARERYGDAESAFKKYIELIPNDPNPYDSYAELLMKMGRFDESITMYRKALATDSNFSNSRFGVASNLMFLGKHDEARKELTQLQERARNDGDRRLAFFATAVTYADQGSYDRAAEELQNEYGVAEKAGDNAAMSADVTAIGDVLLEAGKPDQARERYEQALRLQERSDLPAEVKANARLVHHYNLGRVALATHDVTGAKQHADTFLQGAMVKKNDAQIRLGHELLGAIALEEKQFARATAELNQGNQQDPYTLYRLGQAYQANGHAGKAAEYFRRAADQNTLPTLNLAFVRTKTRKAKV
jgi:tetratricopeptide (TPR) repeat protein